MTPLGWGASRGIGLGLGGAAGIAAAGPWWLAGGCPAPVFAYQPRGAATLAASYVNLANPGTNDCAPGTAPTLSAEGWVFAAASSQYLLTPTQTITDSWSLIARYAGTSGDTRTLIGSVDGVAPKWLSLMIRSTSVRYDRGSAAHVTPTLAAGVIANTPTGRYRNGVAEGGALTAITTFTLPVGIGVLRNSAGRQWYFEGTLVAVAAYSVDIAAYVVAMTAAMAAL
jgi:hypothetical protein